MPSRYDKVVIRRKERKGKERRNSFWSVSSDVLIEVRAEYESQPLDSFDRHFLQAVHLKESEFGARHCHLNSSEPSAIS